MPCLCPSDALSGKLASKNSEIETLKETIDQLKARELQRLEELKVEELEGRVSNREGDEG